MPVAHGVRITEPKLDFGFKAEGAGFWKLDWPELALSGPGTPV